MREQPPRNTDTLLPYVVGLDLSLTKTGIGWAGLHTGAVRHGREGVTTLPLPQKLDAIDTLAEHILDLCWNPRHPDGSRVWASERQPALVVLEAPDVSSSHGGLVERLWLHHDVLKGLHGGGVPIAELPSGLLKGYATGTGSTRTVDGVDHKTRVKNAVMQYWPEYHAVRLQWSARPLDDNESDAAVLAQAGLEWLTGGGRVPGTHSAYLRRSTARWPEAAR